MTRCVSALRCMPLLGVSLRYTFLLSRALRPRVVKPVQVLVLAQVTLSHERINLRPVPDILFIEVEDIHESGVGTAFNVFSILFRHNLGARDCFIEVLGPHQNHPLLVNLAGTTFYFGVKEDALRAIPRLITHEATYSNFSHIEDIRLTLGMTGEPARLLMRGSLIASPVHPLVRLAADFTTPGSGNTPGTPSATSRQQLQVRRPRPPT